MTKLNPVVQKIAEQAKGFVDLNQHVGGGNGCMIYTYEGLNKFAELLVEECVAQCWTVSESESKGSVVSECSKRIRKHFGVEDTKREQFDKAIKAAFKDGADLSGKETP
jgi:hypothetical protein